MEQDFNLHVKLDTGDAVQGLTNIKNAADQAATSVGKIGENAQSAAQEVSKVGEVASESIPKVQGLGNAFENVFQNSVQDAQKLGGTLGDVFKGVRQSIPVIKQLNSTALKGLTGIKAALASLGIGLVITAVSLLTSWFIKLVGESIKAKRGLADLNKEIDKGASSAAAQIVSLRQLSERYKQLGDDAKAKEKFLKDYREEIEKTGIAIGDINTAEDVFVGNTGKYIAGLIARAKAEAAYKLAIEETEKGLSRITEIDEKIAKQEELLENLPSILNSKWSSTKANAESYLKTLKARREKLKADLDETLNALLNKTKEYSDQANQYLALGGTSNTEGKGNDKGNDKGNGGGGKGNPTAQEIYDKWAKEHPELVLRGELAVRAWEKQIEKEGKMAAELARLRELLSQPAAIKEEEVEEESPKEYLTKLQERRRAAFDNQKELLDIEVLSAKEKNNALYDLEMERLDSEGEYLLQMRNLTIEDSEEREELDQKIEENEQQKEIVRKKRQEQHKKDVAEEIQMYAEAAASIASIFGTVAQAEEERIQRQVENEEITEAEAERQFETVKNWQLAENWINTAAGITRALTGVDTTLGPPAWIAQAAQAAALLANGIAQDRRIRSTQFGGGASGGGGGVSAPSVGVTPIEVTEDIQQSPSVLANSQSPRDQRVYILEGDIQESDRRVEIREENSTF